MSNASGVPNTYPCFPQVPKHIYTHPSQEQELPGSGGLFVNEENKVCDAEENESPPPFCP